MTKKPSPKKLFNLEKKWWPELSQTKWSKEKYKNTIDGVALAIKFPFNKEWKGRVIRVSTKGSRKLTKYQPWLVEMLVKDYLYVIANDVEPEK